MTIENTKKVRRKRRETDETDEMIDKLLKEYRTPEEVVGEGGLLAQLTKRLLERAMSAELTEHVGYERGDPEGRNSGNSRNGNSQKTLKGTFGTIPLEVPRDRAGTFEPQIIGKHQTRFKGFDDKIVSLYARGLSTREIQMHLEEIYQVEVSPGLISTVTEEVIDEVRAWQNRQLEEIYPIIYMDALQFKVRDSGRVRNKAVYLAIGVNLSGVKEMLGMWIAQTEGAKFWLQIVTELRNRGVQEVFIACVDGLKGFPEAIEAVFPQTIVQTCIVHLIRQSLRYVPRRQYDAVAKDLKPIYTAINADQALLELDAFEQKWGQQLPVIGQAWRSAWEYVTPFMAFEPEVRRVIYTTNAIEALNRQLRKAVKTKGSFPSEDAARKLLFLAIQNAVPQWTKTRGWTKALLAFKIQFGDRLPD